MPKKIKVTQVTLDASVFLESLELIETLVADISWCGGSGDFAPGGKAEKGWKRGPLKNLQRAHAFLDSKTTSGLTLREVRNFVQK